MTAMTFHETYGEIPKRLLRTIKRHNVSPADFFVLEERHGDDFKAIENDIVDFVHNGQFSFWLWANGGN